MDIKRDEAFRWLLILQNLNIESGKSIKFFAPEQTLEVGSIKSSTITDRLITGVDCIPFGAGSIRVTIIFAESKVTLMRNGYAAEIFNFDRLAFCLDSGNNLTGAETYIIFEEKPVFFNLELIQI